MLAVAKEEADVCLSARSNFSPSKELSPWGLWACWGGIPVLSPPLEYLSPHPSLDCLVLIGKVYSREGFRPNEGDQLYPEIRVTWLTLDPSEITKSLWTM